MKFFRKKHKKYEVKNFKGNVELHEIFLDKLAKKREAELGVSEIKFEVPLSRELTHILFGIFLFIVLTFFVRTFYLQVIKAEDYTFLSENNRTRISFINPERGVIYDRNMGQIVWNGPAFDLICDKRDLHPSSYERLKEIREIARIIEKDPDKLKEEIVQSEETRILISENLSHQTLVRLETRIRDFPGFQIEKNIARDYPFGLQFSHLIGYIGKISKEELKNSEDYSITDSIGKMGIEKSYEDILRGEPGEMRCEKDTQGYRKSEEILTLPEPGKSLVLNLDSNLQKKLVEELERILKEVKAEKAAAVALDPKTGGILALVSVPSFDNNLLSKGISLDELNKLKNNPLKPFFNRVISGGYHTGSTIKPLIAGAVLEEGIISPNKKLYCPLELCLFNKYSGEKKCFYDWKFHGWTNLREAIAKSVNPFFYIIGGGYVAPNFADSRLPKSFEGLGSEKIKKWLNLFNWGEKTGIDLPEEIKGRVPDPEWKENYFKDSERKTWTIGDTYHLSIGQGDILITPLQVVTAFGAVANGGTIYQPQIVQKIITGSAESMEVIEEIKPKIIRKDFISLENLQVVREGMREAVTYGSSVILNSLPVESAAKTGTAEINKEGYYHHWVTVFAPYDDPQIVLTVIIEEVEGLHSAALPVAKGVLEWYFTPESFDQEDKIR